MRTIGTSSSRRKIEPQPNLARVAPPSPERLRSECVDEIQRDGRHGGPQNTLAGRPDALFASLVFESQGFGLALVESASDWHVFAVWINASGGL